MIISLIPTNLIMDPRQVASTSPRTRGSMVPRQWGSGRWICIVSPPSSTETRSSRRMIFGLWVGRECGSCECCSWRSGRDASEEECRLNSSGNWKSSESCERVIRGHNPVISLVTNTMGLPGTAHAHASTDEKE